MALAKVSDVIKSSMRKLGALRRGKAPTNDEYSDFLDLLNTMLRLASTELGMQSVPYSRTFTWPAGVSSRTLGPSGADFTSARPLRFLDGCSFVDTAAGVRYPVELVPKLTDDSVVIPSIQGIPYQLYAERGLTNWTLYPVYVPVIATMQVRLSTLEPLSEYTAVTNDIGLPIEYHSWLVYNLALEIAPEVGREPSRIVILRAQESKDAIKLLHTVPPPRVPVAVMLLSARRFNIRDGGFGQ